MQVGVAWAEQRALDCRVKLRSRAVCCSFGAHTVVRHGLHLGAALHARLLHPAPTCTPCAHIAADRCALDPLLRGDTHLQDLPPNPGRQAALRGIARGGQRPGHADGATHGTPPCGARAACNFGRVGFGGILPCLARACPWYQAGVPGLAEGPRAHSEVPDPARRPPAVGCSHGASREQRRSAKLRYAAQAAADAGPPEHGPPGDSVAPATHSAREAPGGTGGKRALSSGRA